MSIAVQGAKYLGKRGSMNLFVFELMNPWSYCFFQLAVEFLVEDLKGKFVAKNLDNDVERRRPPPIGKFPLKGFLNRSEVLKEMISYLKNYECRVSTGSDKAPPMGGVHCTTGGGKTKILCMIAGTPDLHDEISEPDSKLYQELRTKLQGYAIVAVTFSSFSSKGDETNPYMALAIRALYS